MRHIRIASPNRRIVVDSHDLRIGVFYTDACGSVPASAWLHLPGLVIQLCGG